MDENTNMNGTNSENTNTKFTMDDIEPTVPLNPAVSITPATPVMDSTPVETAATVTDSAPVETAATVTDSAPVEVAATVMEETPVTMPVENNPFATPYSQPVTSETYPSDYSQPMVSETYGYNNQYSQSTNNTTSTASYTSTPAEPFSQGMAIASLVLGIFSILFACCCTILGIILGIVGIVLGCMQKPNPDTGKKPGMAIAGIICSACGIAFCIISGIIGAASAISNM